VDDSDEPFKWGLPDLDGLRQYVLPSFSSTPILMKHNSFFGGELGWLQKKVDELLLPVIQRMRKRQQVIIMLR
jgi:DNA excision repair protein ERCC-5